MSWFFGWVWRRRLFKPLLDPLREFRLIWRAVESLAGILVGILAWITTRNLGVSLLAGLVAEFILYEYVLEPWSKRRIASGKMSFVGPYWERGPHDGESFLIQ